MKVNLPSRKKNFKSQRRTFIFLIKKLFFLKITWLILAVILVVICLPFIVFYFFRPLIHPNINFGVTFSNKYASEMGLDWRETYLATLDDLNVKSVRLPVYWEDVESSRGAYDYSDIKWQLDQAQKRDVQIILALGRKVPRWPECFEPDWWNEISQEDIREYELLKYIENTITQLKDYSNIAMWQVENEPFFPFGECKFKIKKETLQKEVSLVRSLDARPIVIQDSGEGGYWFNVYRQGDYLAISMYRKIWMDFWATLLKRSVFFQYPFPDWSYRLKAFLTFVPADKIIVSELQAEPWGPGINSSLPDNIKDQTMSRTDFLNIITYAQKSGFENIYFWGVEWWYFEKTKMDESFYWDTAKALFN